jgi:hypothetical protein
MSRSTTTLKIIVLSATLFLIAWTMWTKGRVEQESFTNACMHMPPYGPVYEPEKWNTHRTIKSAHNCYAYAINDRSPTLTARCNRLLSVPPRKATCVSLRPKPGSFANYKPPPREKRMSCRGLKNGILADNPNILPGQRTQPCPACHYKIAYAVRPNETYHFYRQDRDGLWSHKDGGHAVTRKDVSGKEITDQNDPSTADRGKYTKFCNFLCVPENRHSATHMSP